MIITFIEFFGLKQQNIVVFLIRLMWTKTKQRWGVHYLARRSLAPVGRSCRHRWYLIGPFAGYKRPCLCFIPLFIRIFLTYSHRHSHVATEHVPPRIRTLRVPVQFSRIRKVHWMIGRGFRIEVPTWSEAWPDGSDVKASKWQRDILGETPEDWRGKIGTGLDCSTGGSAYSILNCRSTFRCLSL